MKNSKEYSQKVQKLYRLLKRKYPKVQEVVYDEPADALVYAIVSERTKQAKVRSVIRKFDDYFVDLNELRVSRVGEIVEVLGGNTVVAGDIASTITRVLRAVFERYNTVSLKSLKRIGKRPAKQALEKIDGVSRFMVNYCMLTSLQGHAIPLTKRMIDYLKSNQMVHPDADHQQIEGFLARQISAKNAYEFYALLRRESERRKTRQKHEQKAAKKLETKENKQIGN